MRLLQRLLCSVSLAAIVLVPARATPPPAAAPPAAVPSVEAPAVALPASPVRVHVVRLRPGDDLRGALQAFAKARQLRAAFVITCVGSLREARLRLANHGDGTAVAGPLEIVSLVGTLSADGCHLHASVSNGEGRTSGGHLLEGCPVYTTAEVVIGEAEALRFERRTDSATSFPELEVKRRVDP